MSSRNWERVYEITCDKRIQLHTDSSHEKLCTNMERLGENMKNRVVGLWAVW